VIVIGQAWFDELADNSSRYRLVNISTPVAITVDTWGKYQM
jgi:hypothetical protein